MMITRPERPLLLLFSFQFIARSMNNIFTELSHATIQLLPINEKIYSPSRRNAEIDACLW